MAAPVVAAAVAKPAMKSIGKMILKDMAKGAALEGGRQLASGVLNAGGTGGDRSQSLTTNPYEAFQDTSDERFEELERKRKEDLDYLEDMIKAAGGVDNPLEYDEGDDTEVSDAQKKQVIQDLQDKRKKGGVINKADLQKLQDEYDRVAALPTSTLPQPTSVGANYRDEMSRLIDRGNTVNAVGSIAGLILGGLGKAGALGKFRQEAIADEQRGAGLGGVIKGLTAQARNSFFQKALDHFSSEKESNLLETIEKLELSSMTDWQKQQLISQATRQKDAAIRAERIRLGLEKPSDGRIKDIKDIKDGELVVGLLRSGCVLSSEDYKELEGVDPREVATAILRAGKPYSGNELQFLDDMLGDEDKYQYDVSNAKDWRDDVLNGYMKHIRNFHYTYKPEATEVDPSIDPQEEHIGPMAQDIEKVNPACIQETPEGIKTVDTGRLALMNAGAIAELAREIAELKEAI